MHPLNDAGCDGLPVFDEWPQPLRMKYEPDSVVWLHRELRFIGQNNNELKWRSTIATFMCYAKAT